ncbi:MAG: DUF3298 domain-containing protein, partial [Lachnospiraceae bacterium]|nr:DUF3298 domain-containing protein [Lachnospiraceae bacterium]
MQKMKKAVALMLVFVLTAGLVACGKKAEEKKPESSAPVEKTEEKANTDTADTKETAEDESEDEGEIIEITPSSDEADESGLLRVGVARSSEYYYDEETYNILAYAKYNNISLLAGSDTYPELAASLDEMSSGIKARTLGEFEMLKSSVESDKDSEEGLLMNYFTEESTNIVRADDKAVSIVDVVSSYTGGAHENLGIYTYNYDTQTGKQLSLKDVIKDEEGFLKLIIDQAKKNADEGIVDPEEYIRKAYNEEGYWLSWVLSYTGIDVYFAPYEIASYAAGVITASVTFKDNPEIFNDAYTKVPEYYEVALSGLGKVLADTNGDGAPEELTVWKIQSDEADDLYKLVVYVGEKLIVDDEEFLNFDYNCIFAHNSNGDYIIIDGQSYNDCHTTRVYDIASGKMTDELLGTGLVRYGTYDDYPFCYEVAGNPEKKELFTRLEALGTYDAFRNYSLEDGKLKPETEYYYYDDGAVTLRNAVGLTLDVCDKDGNVTGETDVKPGEYFTYLYTDNATFMMCSLSDGTIVKLDMDISEYPQQVEGQDV